MSLSKKQRAQVVELLRCAADLHTIGLGGVGMATSWLYGDAHPEPPCWFQCVLAWNDAVNTFTSWGGTTYADVCLEAAQRVEEGSWP